MRSPRGRRLAAIAVLGAVSWLACSESPTAPGPPIVPVARIEISPTDVVLESGGTLSLEATPRSATGLALEGRPITWSSSNTAVAAVSATGIVTAGNVTGGAGVAVTITASSGTVSGSTSVTVLPLPVTSVRFSSDSIVLLPGRDTTLAVVVEGAGALPLSGRVISWTLSDTAVARITQSGALSVRAFFGPETRSTVIRASVEGRGDSLVLRVPPLPVASLRLATDSATLFPGDTLVLSAQAFDSVGRTLSSRPITWQSSTPAVVGVDTVGRLITALYSGIATRTAAIIASSAGRADTAAIRVRPSAIGALRIVNDTTRLTVGSTAAVMAEVLSDRGQTLVDRVVTWRTADTSIATVSPAGNVTGSEYLGSATRQTQVTATIETFADSIAVIVSPLPVATVTLTPSTLTLRTATQASLTATARDAGGRALLPRPTLWSTTDATVATIDSTGTITAPLYLGPSARVAQVRATIDGITGQATTTVNPLRADTLRIVTDSITLTSGAGTRIAVTVTDSAGNALVGRSVAWESTDAAAAVVVGTDSIVATNYTGPESRSGLLIARLGALVDTVRLGVHPRPVQSVRMSAALADLEFGDSVRISAVALDAAGGTLTQRPIAWTSTNATIAVVNDEGLVTALNTEGETLIIASSEGRADSARVIVAGPPREWATVTAGRTACAIDVAGAMFCWGGVFVGDGSSQVQTTPVRVAFGDTYRAVSGASCAVTTANVAQCWGSNSFGMLGIGDANSSSTRSAPANTNTAVRFRDVQVGVTDVCALAADSTAYCWGRGQFGQLGNGAIGTSAQRTSPTAVLGGLKFAQLSVGVDHTCAVTTGAAAYCWGAGNWGQLGDGIGWGGLTVIDHREWSPKLITGHQFIQIVAGNGASCGLKVSGEVFCWGRNDYGQTGDGSSFALNSPRNTPAPVSGGLSFSALVARGHRMCGRVGTSEWYCWGTNADGLLGDAVGAIANVPVPLPTAGLAFTTLSLQSADLDGRGGFCGRLADARVYCWGSNSDGQLGRGSISTMERTPRLVR